MTQLEITDSTQHQFPELQREVPGAVPQEVARYAVHNQVTIDPALQTYSRHTINHNPSGYYGLESDAQQLLVHAALSPDMSREEGNYTTADIDAEVGEGNTYNWQHQDLTHSVETSSAPSGDAVSQRGQETVEKDDLSQRAASLAERLRTHPLQGHSGTRPFASGAMNTHVQRFAAVTEVARERAIADPASAVQIRRPVQ